VAFAELGLKYSYIVPFILKGNEVNRDNYVEPGSESVTSESKTAFLFTGRRSCNTKIDSNFITNRRIFHE
jgi:hypothetical protein